VANDSEGYLLALALPAWIELVRPRLAGRRSQWPVTALAAVAAFLAFALLYDTTSVAGTIKTLNETLFALALLVPYVQPWGRPSPGAAAGLAAAVVAATVAFDHSTLVWLPTQLAEGVVMLVLAPIAFDVTDRGILRPDRPSPLRLRVSWWALLVAIPLGVIALDHLSLHGVVGDAAHYVARAQEAFVGMLLIELYFAVRTWGRERRGPLG
jgi:hypothetical protein